MAQAGYYHANHLASKIRDELKDNQTQMSALLKDFSGNTYENAITDATNTNIASVNVTAQINVQTETLKVLQQLQTQLHTLSNEVKNGTKMARKGNIKNA